MVKAGKKSAADSPTIAPQQIQKAVQALLKHEENKRQEQPAQLIESQQSLWLVISMKTIPAKHRPTPVKMYP